MYTDPGGQLLNFHFAVIRRTFLIQIILATKMQAIVCESIVGWRERVDGIGTRLILLLTDEGYHFAGEGRVRIAATIVKTFFCVLLKCLSSWKLQLLN